MEKGELLKKLQYGYEVEVQAEASYREIVNDIDDESDKKIISGIIKDEQRHQEIVKNLIEIVHKHYK